MGTAKPIVYTIGHSTHPVGHFLALLKQHGVTALCDVRSVPYSRMNPQFNRESLKHAVRDAGIAYVFLGEEFGARSQDPSCYERGKVQYDRLAESSLFRKGLDRVEDGVKHLRLALMCAEKDPLQCHRAILVARHLDALGIKVYHILSDGSLETHAQALVRLIRQLRLPEYDMFRTEEELLDEAYRIQGERIAYEETATTSEGESMPVAVR